jgi:hypothetical protein
MVSMDRHEMKWHNIRRTRSKKCLEKRKSNHEAASGESSKS